MCKKEDCPEQKAPLRFTGEALLYSTGQLCVEIFLVQQALALGHADAGDCVAHHVQGGDEHLDGAVDGKDEGVGQQGAVLKKKEQIPSTALAPLCAAGVVC